MKDHPLKMLLSGIVVGLREAKVTFRQSTDSKGGCRILSDKDCRCFLCLCDEKIAKVENDIKEYQLDEV